MSSIPKMPITEMYSLVTRQEKNWGVRGYQIPKKYFDHIKRKRQRELFEASLKPVIGRHRANHQGPRQV